MLNTSSGLCYWLLLVIVRIFPLFCFHLVLLGVTYAAVWLNKCDAEHLSVEVLGPHIL